MFAHGRSAFLAGIVGTALALTGCASVSSSSSSSGGGASKSVSAKASNYKVCYEVDTEGVHDSGFYQLAYQGLQQAQSTLGIKFIYTVATGPSDYGTIMTTFLHSNCSLILEVGQLFEPITLAAAKANPHQKFALIDAEFTNKSGKVQVLPNAANVVFGDVQATFLLGYAAAGMTKTGTVAEWGGQNFSAVTDHEVGFELGVEYYNKVHGTHIKLLGWSNATQKGTFIGNFTDQTAGYQVTQQQINAGADEIYSVGSAAALGAAAAARAHKGVTVMWTDNDACTTPQYAKQVCPVQLNTALKRIDVSVYGIVKSAVTSGFAGGVKYYTLANGGVALGPFHHYASRVPAKLTKELKNLQAAIIAGKVKLPKLWS
jgi:basic membrane protein A and related proteins